MTSPSGDDLARIGRTLLDPASHPGELRETVMEFAELCGRITGIDVAGGDRAFERDTLLAAGKAVSPLTAARCARELARTAVFVRGLEAALVAASARFEARPLHVLYAGCGPYATLILPLLPFLDPEDVRFTLVDVHQEALAGALAVIRHFGFEKCVAGTLKADATTHDFGALRPIHVALTETMQQALAKEPQVAVSANLVRHLEPEGILVPERVTVSLVLLDPKREFTLLPPDFPPDRELPRSERVRVPLGEVMVLDRKTASAYPHSLPTPLIRLPGPAARNRLVPALLTGIQVFGPHVLGDYDCSLTLPVMLRPSEVPGEDADLRFHYRTGTRPGIEWEWRGLQDGVPGNSNCGH